MRAVSIVIFWKAGLNAVIIDEVECFGLAQYLWPLARPGLDVKALEANFSKNRTRRQT